MSKAKIRREDMVVVIAGKDRDLTKARRVLEVLPGSERMLVEGANLVKRHTRPNPQKNIKGGIVERESPIHVSNLAIFDPEAKRPTRIGVKVLKDGRRVRVTKRSGTQLDK